MQKLSGLIVSAGGLLLLNSFLAGAAQAQDAKAVVDKTNAVYKGMKTLQATFETSMIAAGKGNATVQTEVKVVAGQKANINIHPVGKGSGAMGTQLTGMNMRIVDDGASSYMYMSKGNQFMKQKHSPLIFQSVVSGYGLPYSGMNPSTGAYKLLAPSSVDGKPVYVLEYTPPKSNGSTKIDLLIDKATYHIKQSKITQASAQASGSVTTVVKNEILNAPIPANTFVFTPPSGAKEMKMPTGSPGAGGAPGAPR